MAPSDFAIAQPPPSMKEAFIVSPHRGGCHKVTGGVVVVCAVSSPNRYHFLSLFLSSIFPYSSSIQVLFLLIKVSICQRNINFGALICKTPCVSKRIERDFLQDFVILICISFIFSAAPCPYT